MPFLLHAFVEGVRAYALFELGKKAYYKVGEYALRSAVPVSPPAADPPRTE